MFQPGAQADLRNQVEFIDRRNFDRAVRVERVAASEAFNSFLTVCNVLQSLVGETPHGEAERVSFSRKAECVLEVTKAGAPF